MPNAPYRLVGETGSLLISATASMSTDVDESFLNLGWSLVGVSIYDDEASDEIDPEGINPRLSEPEVIVVGIVGADRRS